MTRYLALKPASRLSRSAISAFDPNVSFLSFVRLAIRGYAESPDVAGVALSAAVHVPKNRFIRHMKWWMLRLQYNWSRRYFERHPDTVALCWNGLNSSRRVFVEGARAAGAPVVLFELAPLPHRVTIDAKGVNYFNSLPRHADFYLDWQRLHPELENRWREVRESIVSRQAGKNAKVQQIQRSIPQDQRPYLFVPLQVQNDSQIRLFGGMVKSVPHFVEMLDRHAGALPEGWTLRIKEHPTSKIPYGLDRIIKNSSKVIVDNVTDTMQLIKDSEGVITINSSVGLEAMFFEKPVLVLGEAFYGFDRVANRIASEDELPGVFSNPLESFVLDRPSASAFLNYLACVYYPSVEMDQHGVRSISPEWLAAFKTELRLR